MRKLIALICYLIPLSAIAQPGITIMPGNNAPRFAFNQLFRYYAGTYHSVLDKDSIGKGSITFTSGIWQANPISTTYGGTGLTSLGSALQSIRVNAAGTGLEYYTPSGGSGSVTNFIFTNGGGFTGTVTNSTSTPTLSLVLQDAGASQSGQVNIAAQTFGGLKTFQGGIIVNNSTVSANQFIIGTGTGGYGWVGANAGSPVTRVDLRGYFGGAQVVNLSTTSFSYFNTGAGFGIGTNTSANYGLDAQLNLSNGFFRAGNLKVDASGYANAPMVLATVTGIDTKTTGPTALFTVPTGKTLVVTGVYLKCTAATAITAGAQADVGVTAASVYTNANIAMTTATQSYQFPTGGIMTPPTAGQVLNLNINTPATGTSQTITAIVVGFLL